jgi:hypothetical protein
MLKIEKSEVFKNILFCIIVCVLSIIDHLNAIEYLFFAEFHSKIFKIMILIFIIVHPIVLLFYYLITLLYIGYIMDQDFDELTSDFEYYELIYFRNKIKETKWWLLPLAFYLTFLSYFKFFSLYSIKFIIELKNMQVFKNIITTTLYHAVILQSIFQSLPQIILQVFNNLLLMEDKHHMRGVFNFSTLFSLAFMGMGIILYFRERDMQNKIIEERGKVNKIIL